MSQGHPALRPAWRPGCCAGAAGLAAAACCLLLAAVSRAATPLATTTAPSPGRTVLLLNSYHQGFVWTDKIVSAVTRELSRRIGDLNLRIEYMDTKRHSGPEYSELLRQVFRLKYKDVKLDAIIASDDDALRFLLRYHDELFGQVPVVFCGINDYDPSLLAGRPLFTGTTEAQDIRATLEAAMGLQPSVRRVVVIADATPTGIGLRKAVAETSGSFPNLNFEYLDGSGLTTEELLAKLRTLPKDSVVLATIWMKDKTGTYFPIEQWFPKITASASVPLYALVDDWMPHGAVGGKLISGTLQGQRAAEMALQIMLEGKRPSDLPVRTDPFNAFIFSYDAMKRFGLDESRLPPGSLVINRPFSFYQTYKHLVWSVGGAMLAMAALIVGLSVAIVQRRRAEEGLRSLFEGVPDAVFVHDREGRILYCNEATCRRLGYSRQELLRMHTRDIDAPQFAAGFPQRLAEQLKAGKFSCEGVQMTKDGRRIPVDINTSLLSYHGHQAILAVVRDITDRKRDEEQRRQLQAQVQHAQKLESLGVLAGGIAHDFNNLLVGVLGNADLALADLPPGSPAQAVVHQIRQAAVRASELTNQMLAYSGRGAFVVEVLDLNNLVREIGGLLRISVPRTAELKYALCEGPPAVEADAAQIRQVVMNLITNAADAIGEAPGAITVTTGVMDADAAYLADANPQEPSPPGRYVYLEVADTGCGMDDATRARIFEPFFTTKFAGRGLGLSALLGIVRGHRGTVKVYSQVGLGSTFRVLLPVSDKPAPSRQPQAAPALPAAPAPPPGEHKATILVVDDEETVRKVSAAMLERSGYRVLTASGGRQAVEVFRQHRARISLILLDMTMPEMDGRETFRALREIDPAVRAVLCSGYGEQDATSRFAIEGLAGFLQKPFELAALRLKVREALAGRP